MGTVEKLTVENMGISYRILSLDGTEPEIHLGGHLSPQLQRTVKKIPLNTRVNNTTWKLEKSMYMIIP